MPRPAGPGCPGSRPVSRLAIVADDLTGALDSAARFVPAYGPIGGFWSVSDVPDVGAFDTGTRDLDPDVTLGAIARFAPLLNHRGIAFKKIDSLLRGHVRLELLACLAGFDHCILAPAFPYQGRVTRGGRQYVRSGGGWTPLDIDLRGIDPRVQVRDAETQDDLAAIVEAGWRLPGRVLWCGTGGLAGALAGNRPVPRPLLPAPILALIGSDHPVSIAQVAPMGRAHWRLTATDAAGPGAGVVTVDILPGTPRDQACRQITDAFRALLHRIPRPGTLVVAGGETLRGLCDALGVHHLEVDGEIEPGAPASVMRGGRWDGQRVVSKSGAFGDAGFLARLLSGGGMC
jgi:D-threonate/D-erythronate kinase